jgi:predicted transcriptional regulator
MATITLKLPDEVNETLDHESSRRGVSKSALVREAIEMAFLNASRKQAAASQWLAEWRGTLKDVVPDPDDERLQHLYRKHVK